MKILRNIFLVALLCLFFLVYILYINSDFKIEYKKEIANGNKMIELISEYEKKNNRLPNKKTDFIPKEEINKYEIYYYEFHEFYYVLFFGTTLGEGIYYNSLYGEWSDVYEP